MFCLNTKGLTRVLEQNAWEEIPATGAQTADGQAATATTKDVFGKGCCFFFKVCASISTLPKILQAYKRLQESLFQRVNDFC